MFRVINAPGTTDTREKIWGGGMSERIRRCPNMFKGDRLKRAAKPGYLESLYHICLKFRE